MSICISSFVLRPAAAAHVAARRLSCRLRLGLGLRLVLAFSGSLARRPKATLGLGVPRVAGAAGAEDEGRTILRKQGVQTS